MKNTNKIIIFDWGGVVESHHKDEFNFFTSQINIINKLNPETKNLDDNFIIDTWNKCNYNESGICISETNNQADIDIWFEQLKRKFDLRCNYQEFYKVYQDESDKIVYYKNVVDLSHSLKSQCLIGILSNLSELDKNRINKHYNLSKFDYVWLSFELSCKKPNEEIYIKVENECKIKPENILFIDDVENNIITAQKRGWKTCLANGHQIDKIKIAIENFLR